MDKEKEVEELKFLLKDVEQKIEIYANNSTFLSLSLLCSIDFNDE